MFQCFSGPYSALLDKSSLKGKISSLDLQASPAQAKIIWQVDELFHLFSPRIAGGVCVQEVRGAEAAARAPLLGVRPLRAQGGHT